MILTFVGFWNLLATRDPSESVRIKLFFRKWGGYLHTRDIWVWPYVRNKTGRIWRYRELEQRLSQFLVNNRF